MRTIKQLALAAVVVLLVACKTPTNISYFQDMENLKEYSLQKYDGIRLKPTDKLLIVVKCKNAEITNITVSCDGMPLVVIDNGETISINEGDRYVYFDCYDKDSGVTSAENADESKAFKFDGKNEIEVTFTISGISTR